MTNDEIVQAYGIEIVQAFAAKGPLPSTNKAVVAELAARSGRSVHQIRGILISSGVYASFAKAHHPSPEPDRSSTPDLNPKGDRDNTTRDRILYWSIIILISGLLALTFSGAFTSDHRSGTQRTVDEMCAQSGHC